MFCFTNELLFGLIGLLVVVLIGMALFRHAPNIVVNVPPQRTTVETPRTQVVDTRFGRAPQPLRDWMAAPELPPRGGIASIPINIATQGLPESFQMIGNINVGEGKVLPLYGRRTMSGSSDRWNYYTRTDTFNPVPVPIRYKNRDCMDDIGCAELYSGEHLFVEDLGTTGKARLFRYDGPKYIPGLI